MGTPRNHVPVLLGALLAFACLCALPEQTSAVRSIAWWYDEVITDGWLYGGDDDFVVATVVSVRDSFSTNARPPLVTIKVTEVLRGTLREGRHDVEWPPAPLMIPCAVGEQGNIRRWENTPLKGPAVGSRLILGGMRGADGAWQSDAFLRWDESSSVGMEARRKIREWNANVAARLLRERPERERRRKLAEEQERKDRLARRLAEEERLQNERRWIERERSLRRECDVERLVAISDAVLLSPPPVASAARGAAWAKFAVLRPTTWLLSPRRPQVREELISVAFGQREDSLLHRWRTAPDDDRPGAAAALAIANDSSWRRIRAGPLVEGA
jgi:hypothetical protein